MEKPADAAIPTQQSEQKDIIQGWESAPAKEKEEATYMRGGREEEERMLLSMVLHTAFTNKCMDTSQESC